MCYINECFDQGNLDGQLAVFPSNPSLMSPKPGVKKQENPLNLLFLAYQIINIPDFHME